MKYQKRNYLVIGLLFSLIIINYWYQIIAFNVRPFHSHQCCFRIMSYNVANGSYNKNILRESRKDSLFKIIRDIQPDIICLQECSRWHVKDFDVLLNQEYPYKDHYHSIYSKYEVVNSFIIVPDTISSEYNNIKDLEPVFMDGNRNTGIFYCADLKVDGRTIRIINVRLATNNISTLHAQSLYYKIPTEFKKYYIVSKLRKFQIRNIQQIIAESPYPVILCGDMNDVSGSSALELLSHCGLKDAWWHSGCGYGATYNDMGYVLRIDHILYSNELMPVYSGVFDSQFSDHLPLTVDFIF